MSASHIPKRLVELICAYGDARSKGLSGAVNLALVFTEFDHLATQPQAPQGGVTDEKLFADLGKEMYGITTTVHSPNIPFEEQLRCIPSIWLHCMEERDALLAATDTPEGAKP